MINKLVNYMDTNSKEKESQRPENIFALARLGTRHRSPSKSWNTSLIYDGHNLKCRKRLVMSNICIALISIIYDARLEVLFEGESIFTLNSSVVTMGLI